MFVFFGLQGQKGSERTAVESSQNRRPTADALANTLDYTDMRAACQQEKRTLWMNFIVNVCETRTFGKQTATGGPRVTQRKAAAGACRASPPLASGHGYPCAFS
jgi:hypothetical protein